MRTETLVRHVRTAPHIYRFGDRQRGRSVQAGTSSYVVAERDGVLAEFGEVLWDGCRIAWSFAVSDLSGDHGLAAFPAGQGNRYRTDTSG